MKFVQKAPFQCKLHITQVEVIANPSFHRSVNPVDVPLPNSCSGADQSEYAPSVNNHK